MQGLCITIFLCTLKKILYVIVICSASGTHSESNPFNILWVCSFIGRDHSGLVPKSIRLLVLLGLDRLIVGPGRNRLLMDWFVVELSNSRN
jgi:hypothetical protein